MDYWISVGVPFECRIRLVEVGIGVMPAANSVVLVITNSVRSSVSDTLKAVSPLLSEAS